MGGREGRNSEKKNQDESPSQNTAYAKAVRWNRPYNAWLT